MSGSLMSSRMTSGRCARAMLDCFGAGRGFERPEAAEAQVLHVRLPVVRGVVDDKHERRLRHIRSLVLSLRDSTSRTALITPGG